MARNIKVDADTWLSTARASYRGEPSAAPVVRGSPQRSIRRSGAAPRFTAMSNYEVSFPDRETTPLPVSPCKPDVRPSKNLPFTVTSTVRDSYVEHTNAAFPKRAKSPTRQAFQQVAFTAQAESRRSYIDHKITKVPERQKPEARVVGPRQFTAVSTNQASFCEPTIQKSGSGCAP